MPRTSRRPSLLTPAAMVTATDTIFPAHLCSYHYISGIQPDIRPVAFRWAGQKGLHFVIDPRRTDG